MKPYMQIKIKFETLAQLAQFITFHDLNKEWIV